MRIEMSDEELQKMVLKERGFNGTFNVVTSVKIQEKTPKLTFLFTIKKETIKEENEGK